MSKIYVIGDAESGVVFIRLAPWRAAFISADQITTFAQSENQTPEDIFNMISTAAQGWIEQADGSPTQPGFCFVADIDDGDWVTTRNPFPPIRYGIGHLAMGDAGFDDGMAYYPTLTFNEGPLELKKRSSKKTARKVPRKKKVARGKTLR